MATTDFEDFEVCAAERPQDAVHAVEHGRKPLFWQSAGL